MTEDAPSRSPTVIIEITNSTELKRMLNMELEPTTKNLMLY